MKYSTAEVLIDEIFPSVNDEDRRLLYEHLMDNRKKYAERYARSLTIPTAEEAKAMILSDMEKRRARAKLKDKK